MRQIVQLERHALVLEQRWLSRWGPRLLFLGLALIAFVWVHPWVEALAGLCVLAWLVLNFLGELVGVPLNVELTADRIRVWGWFGALPRLRTVELPLAEVRLDWEKDGKLVDRVRASLVLGDGRRSWRLGDVVATAADLITLVEVVEAGRQRARARHGSGEEEVPDALQGLASVSAERVRRES